MASNPFSTRHIRPGAMPFLFLESDSATSIVERLREKNWWGQIIGPHGSGKSTLLATLRPELDAAGRNVILIALHQGERRLPPIDRRMLSTASQLVIDGYEQLSWWSRWRVKRLCQQSGAGLLVTSHEDIGLPSIYQTRSSESLARLIVDELIGSGEALISSDEIAAAYQATGGNLRETLFRLYDVYQQKAIASTA